MVVLNPYEPCVANKMVKGKQSTVLWYVGDVKVSHVEQSVVDGTIKFLESNFDKMKTVKGNKHTYLGMDIEIKD